MSKKTISGIVWTGIMGVIALIVGAVGRSILESFSLSALQTLVVVVWAVLLLFLWAFLSWVYAWDRSFK